MQHIVTVQNIKMPPTHTNDELTAAVAKSLRVVVTDIEKIDIVKKSIDARDRRNIFQVYSVNATMRDFATFWKHKNVSEAIIPTYTVSVSTRTLEHRPVVVGSGPAGLFAALTLAEAGLSPIVIERGKDVDARKKDVDLFWQSGKLNAESNVQFGEGGAGTFSDGKLTTGIKDPRITMVINELVEAGAPAEIKYASKPHVGTDKLMDIVKYMRQKITTLGGQFLFEHKLVGLQIVNNCICGCDVETPTGVISFKTQHIVLALGHSARDTFEMLIESGVHLEPKSFAVGVRIEHPQDMINEMQYGDFRHELPPADYKWNVRLPNGRGVYTFCVCPGGVVVAAASEPMRLTTNGMSHYARDAQNTNSAILVEVKPSDYFKGHPLDGVAFQRRLEEQAFLLGGSTFCAPAQLVGDFLQNKKTTQFGSVTPSYQPGVTLCNLRDCLDDFIADSLHEGIILLSKKARGFDNPDAVLTAIESRSSSPVIISRDKDSMQSSISGLFPCGEGSGYAGGIVSAAVDGIRCAEVIYS